MDNINKGEKKRERKKLRVKLAMSRGQNTTAAALGGLRYTDGNNYGCIIKEQAEKTRDLVCLWGRGLLQKMCVFVRNITRVLQYSMLTYPLHSVTLTGVQILE
jgi:hypothetical protein